MKRNIIGILLATTFLITSCTSNKKIESEDEFAIDSAATSPDSSLDKDLSLDSLDEPTATAKKSDAENQDLALENELNNLDSTESKPVVAENTAGASDELSLDEPPVKSDQAADELSLDEPTQTPVKEETPAVVAVPPVEPTPVTVTEEPPAEVTPSVVVADEPTVVAEPLATINSVSYKANDNGGAIEIGANQPLKFTTRLNSTTNQLIVEVENSSLPKKLKRSLNTKDMASSIGSVDIYQKSGSSISRFVVQLRPGAGEPIVQPEGNSLLIIGAAQTNNASAADLRKSSIDGKPVYRLGEDVADLNSEGIMSSDNLEEFLISNNKFYGKKISIDTTGIEIKDAIRFLAEESGVNIVMDESLEGKISLKLKDVPWDQAFILILKSRKLGFKRQGTVVRVARLEDIKKDEDEAIQRMELRKSKVPLVVKRFFIGYANIDELEKKIAQFLTSTSATTTGGTTAATLSVSAAARDSIGKVISDKRTNSLIVTDTEANMAKIEKLIAALDTQPMQVLIEGKVVEAKEEFTRGLGIFWNSVPPTSSSNTAKVGINPALDPGFAVLDSTLSWGQLDILGSLTAQLQLGEREDKVRVLSSPRISVLSSERASISQTAGVLIPKVETNGTGSGTNTTTYEVVQVGVTLEVTPQVSNEGTVTMDLTIDRSFLPTVDAQAPDKRTAKTKVIVRSGQTAVIGGIFESETRTATSGVPGLKDIPIIGRLFKGDRDAKSKNELVIFVTPNVLKPVVGTDKKISEFQ